jgi:hypothetical protein
VADALAAGRPEQEERSMATHPKTDRPIRFEDKEELRRLMEAFNERIGFVPDPDATPEKIQELMRADGIRPEDNAFSREILRMRYGDEE